MRDRAILWAAADRVDVFLLQQNAEVIPSDVEIWPIELIAIGLWLLLERGMVGPGGREWRSAGDDAAEQRADIRLDTGRRASRSAERAEGGPARPPGPP